MRRLPEGAKIIHNDKLVIVWRLLNGDCLAQGKRVKSSCPLNAAERKMYVAELARPAICCKRLMQMRDCTLTQAWAVIKEARGLVRRER